MKKIMLFCFAVAVCAAVVLASFFFVDRKAPEIEVVSTPRIACEIDEEDILGNAYANDDDLKSFFIEEDDLLEIAETGKVTFVAIDEKNNVARKEADVDVDERVYRYHIEQIKPLKLQLDTVLDAGEYFELKNECGWTIKESFEVIGIDTKHIGEYDVTISSKKHPSEKLLSSFEVDDYLAPKIILSYETLENYTGRYWDEDYFLEFVESIEDDADDEDMLRSRVTTNWEAVMNPSESGQVNAPGTYTITYSVTDSDGHVGKASMKVKLREYAEPAVGEEINE